MYTNEFLLNLYERFGDKAQQALDFVKKNAFENQERQVINPTPESGKVIPDGVYYILKDGSFTSDTPDKDAVQAIGIAHDGHYFSVPLDWDYGESRLLKEDKYPEDEYCQKEIEAVMDWDFVKHTNHLKELGLAIELKDGHYLPTAPVFAAMYKNKEELNTALNYAGAEIIDFNKYYWFAQRVIVYTAWLFGGFNRFLNSGNVNGTFQVGAVSLWEPIN